MILLYLTIAVWCIQINVAYPVDQTRNELIRLVRQSQPVLRHNLPSDPHLPPGFVLASSSANSPGEKTLSFNGAGPTREVGVLPSANGPQPSPPNVGQSNSGPGPLSNSGPGNSGPPQPGNGPPPSNGPTPPPLPGTGSDSGEGHHHHGGRQRPDGSNPNGNSGFGSAGSGNPGSGNPGLGNPPPNSFGQGNPNVPGQFQPNPGQGNQGNFQPFQPSSASNFQPGQVPNQPPPNGVPPPNGLPPLSQQGSPDVNSINSAANAGPPNPFGQ